MKKIIFFTHTSSILKHWENALAGLYSPLYIKDLPVLEDYLKNNPNKIPLMVDELSIKDIDNFLALLEKYPHANILIFNSLPEISHASKIISKNVKGYENSYLHKVNLINMLKSVNEGKNWLFPELTNYIINKYVKDSDSKEPDFIGELTPKEKEIAYLIAKGYTNKEIAQTESIALSTVKNHIKNIFEKAGVSDRFSLALKFK